MTSRSDGRLSREVARHASARLALRGAAEVLLWTGSVVAHGAPVGCKWTHTPERISGEVVRLVPGHGKATLRATDGTIHELRVTHDVLQASRGGTAWRRNSGRPPTAPETIRALQTGEGFDPVAHRPRAQTDSIGAWV